MARVGLESIGVGGRARGLTTIWRQKKADRSSSSVALVGKRSIVDRSHEPACPNLRWPRSCLAFWRRSIRFRPGSIVSSGHACQKAKGQGRHAAHAPAFKPDVLASGGWSRDEKQQAALRSLPGAPRRREARERPHRPTNLPLDLTGRVPSNSITPRASEAGRSLIDFDIFPHRTDVRSHPSHHWSAPPGRTRPNHSIVNQDRVDLDSRTSIIIPIAPQHNRRLINKLSRTFPPDLGQIHRQAPPTTSPQVAPSLHRAQQEAAAAAGGSVSVSLRAQLKSSRGWYVRCPRPQQRH